jgi:Uma2 family endonuclease
MSQAPVQSPPARNCVHLSDIDWQTYTRLLRTFGDHRGVRLTYDRGELEIMSPSFLHEDGSNFLGRMIFVLTEELGLPIHGGGSVTMRRRRKKRGLEPDSCFWIANAQAMAGKTKLDLRTDPPPDLAVEIEVSRSALKRLAIYAALGVPEVWRFDGASLTFHLLDAGQYRVAMHSASFPQVAASDLLPFVQQAHQAGDQNAVTRQFRAWVRQHHGLANP